MTEEFRIITHTDFDRAAGECIGRLYESMKKTGTGSSVLVQACIDVAQLVLLDLERTLFKEEATVNG